MLGTTRSAIRPLRGSAGAGGLLLAMLASVGCGLFPPQLEATPCASEDECPVGSHCWLGLCVVVPRDAATGDRAPIVPWTCAPDAGSLQHPFTVEPAMSKRRTDRADGGGPFRVAPLIQPGAGATCHQGDVVAAGLGARIGDSLYEHFDGTQGSIVFWVTPEWNIDDISDSTRHFLRLGDFALGVDGTARGVFVQIGTSRQVFAGALADWTAGSTHFVALRWDIRHLFNGNGHVVLTVDDRAYDGFLDSLQPPALDTPLFIGASDQTGSSVIGALVEGLTIYRRPLTGGNAGVSVGHGAELDAIHNLGHGREPTLVTGSWEVVFALPGDGEVWRLAAPTDTSQAFSHPYRANLLGDPGYLLTDAQRSGWSAVGSASSAGDPLRDDKIFGGGATVTTTAAHSGLRRDFATGSQDALVVRALVHSDGSSVVRLRLLDASTELFHVDGTADSRRDRPDVLVGTAQVATGAALHIELVNLREASGTFVVHQVEVLPNLLLNPSFETGAPSEGQWLPDGWANEAPSVTRQQQNIVHSGTSSLELDEHDLGEGEFHQIIQSVPDMRTPGEFFLVGAWFWWLRDDLPRISITNGCLMALAASAERRNKFSVAGQAISPSWQHVLGVGRRHRDVSNRDDDCWNEIVRFGGSWRSDLGVLIDDAYVVRLARVPLQVTPADLAHSLGANVLQVDGDDVVSQPASGLESNRGAVTVQLALAQPVAADLVFCPAGSVLFALYGDDANYIAVRYLGSGGVQIDATIAGSAWSGPSVAQPIIDDQLLHTLTIEYTAPGTIVLDVDGQTTFDAPLDRRAFSVVPHTILYSPSRPGLPDCDLLIGRAGAQVNTW